MTEGPRSAHPPPTSAAYTHIVRLHMGSVSNRICSKPRTATSLGESTHYRADDDRRSQGFVGQGVRHHRPACARRCSFLIIRPPPDQARGLTVGVRNEERNVGGSPSRRALERGCDPCNRRVGPLRLETRAVDTERRLGEAAAALVSRACCPVPYPFSAIDHVKKIRRASDKIVS